MHLERSPEVQDDPIFFTKICQLTQMADTFAIQNLEKMSLHEYTTTVIYYFNHQDVMSAKLRQALIEKMGRSIQEFNEYQLHVFKKLLSDLKEADDNSQIQEVIANLDLELEAIRREKVLMASEARLREEIQRRIAETIELRKRREKTHKLTGTAADERLERGMKRKSRSEGSAEEVSIEEEKESSSTGQEKKRDVIDLKQRLKNFKKAAAEAASQSVEKEPEVKAAQPLEHEISESNATEPENEPRATEDASSDPLETSSLKRYL